MKIFASVILSFLLSFSAFCSTLSKKIEVGAVERNYLEILPETFDQSKTYPLITFLHPNGVNATDFAEAYRMQMVADLSNSIVLVPEALDEQDSEIKSIYTMATSNGYEFAGMSVNNVWNAGVSVDNKEITSKLGQYAFAFSLLCPNISAAGKIQFNKDVDDISFLNTMIDKAESDYKIYTDSVFMIGASMGGAMTYKYAYDKSSKVKGIAVICGFVGAEVDNSSPLNIPVCIIHSKSDSVVKYNGGYFNGDTPTLVKNIAQKNGCDIESVENKKIADIAFDGISVETFKYECEESKRVLFYSLDGATHADFLISDYVSGPNDIDYYIEVYNFLFNTKTENSVEEYLSNKILVYPNPATNYIYSRMTGQYVVSNINGDIVKKGRVGLDEKIFIGNLNKGFYLLTIENNGNKYQTKILKK